MFKWTYLDFSPVYAVSISLKYKCYNWSLVSGNSDKKFYLAPSKLSCLNFWDEACWFLSLSVFGLLPSSLLLFPQCFSHYVLRPSSGFCWTQKPSQNFELCPLLNPWGLLNYWFPYCIQLYTWSTQQIIVAQHMCWFLKTSNPPMFSPINYFNFIP